MHIDYLDQAAAGGAALVAGVVNALAGGGTLISFPTLVGLGVPAVPANVTNTVSLLPGYLSGAHAQRHDLAPQLEQARLLAAVAAAGGLAGSVLLVLLPGSAFRVAVPYLVLLSCGLLAFGERLRPRGRLQPSDRPGPDTGPDTGPNRSSRVEHGALALSVFLGAVYGGFFGAGLGIMLLAVLGLFSDESLVKLNALKQALSFVVNFVAAVFFLFSGKVVWILVPVMAVASLAGGMAGGRLVTVIDPRLLRRLVVIAGVGVAISFWVA